MILSAGSSGLCLISPCDDDHIEVPDEQEPLDGEFSPSLSTTRTTGEGVETKMLFGICGTIGCATTAFLAWRLAKRLLAPLLQEKKSQPRRPQIVIVHKDPLLEDLRRSDELIKELRAVTELPPFTSSSSFNSSTTLGENGSMLADALVHNEGAITMAQPTTRRSSLPALQEQSNNRRASYWKGTRHNNCNHYDQRDRTIVSIHTFLLSFLSSFYSLSLL